MKKKTIFLAISVFLIFFLSCDNKPDGDSFIFGIDVSHYNGNINWEEVKKQKKHKKIKFVIIRSSAGTRSDRLFQENFSKARNHGFVVGAYHYYDPNENSTLQASHFISKVTLQKGDICPVLDIEELSRVQSLDNLRKGLKNWLDIVEEYYGVKPIIYTGLAFYEDYLMRHGFSHYPLWIAAYSSSKKKHKIVQESCIHQFSERVRIPGISGYTDGNNTTKKKFSGLLIK